MIHLSRSVYVEPGLLIISHAVYHWHPGDFVSNFVTGDFDAASINQYLPLQGRYQEERCLISGY